jgi:hypothetical protein
MFDIAVVEAGKGAVHSALLRHRETDCCPHAFVYAVGCVRKDFRDSEVSPSP